MRIETGIPYGNACDAVAERTATGWRISFSPDPHGGPESLWFCYRLAAKGGTGGEGDRIELVLRNVPTILGGGSHPSEDQRNIRPVVRRDGGDWERLGPGRALKYKDGRVDVSWETVAGKECMDVAACYPYGREEVEALAAESSGALRLDTIGVSQGGRPVERISNSHGEEASDRPGLYLVARQHSGETPGSWVLDGFLRKTISISDAPLVWAVPLSNIDGVESGDYGKDNFPYDLNRAWGNPAMRHEVLVMQADMAAWARRCRPVLGIDFHAPGACEGEGAYVFNVDPGKDREQHDAIARWAEIFREALAPEYTAKEFCQVPSYAERWSTPLFKTYCWSAFRVPGLGFETPYSVAGNLVLTRDTYRQIGARMAASVAKACER